MAPRSQAAELAALRATLEAFMTHQREREVQFEEAQAKATQQIGELQASQRDLERTQGRILERIDVVEPITTMVTTFRSYITGALFVLGIVGAVIWWVARELWERFMG